MSLPERALRFIAYSRYPKAVWWAMDVQLNAIAGGVSGQTISDRVSDKTGRWYRRVVGWVTDLFDRRPEPHLDQSQHPDKTVRGFFAKSWVMGVAFLLIAFMLVALWFWAVAAVRWIVVPFYTITLAWLLIQHPLRKVLR